jgi:4-amino-4-deoxy-L-arabinose transferase-like glycosyltransferase
MHINGIRWLEKAPLHYWLVAATYATLGENTFAGRLPLALSVIALVLMTYAFGRHFFSERAGFYAGLAMCTSLGTWIFTRTMIPEAIYALEYVAAFYLFLRAWEGSLSPRAGYWGAAAVMGLAVLTRALIGLIFPVGAITIFLLAVRGRDAQGAPRWRALPVWSSAIVFLLIAAPWHIIVSLRTPGFFDFYFFNEHFLRALGWRYPQDYGSVPLGIWWLEQIGWLFPWSSFLPFAAREFPRMREWGQLDRGGQARLLLFAWAAVILVFFSISKRMEYYSFGAWPALALLAGLALARLEEESSVWLRRTGAALAGFGALVAAMLFALVWHSRHIPSNADIAQLLNVYEISNTTAFDNFTFLSTQAFAVLRWPALGAAAALLIALVGSWLLRRQGRAPAATLALAGGMTMFLLAANFGFAQFEPFMSSRALAEKLLTVMRPGDRLVIYGDYYGGSTLGFYAHLQTWMLNGRYNGLEFGSNYPDAPQLFLTDAQFPRLWSSQQRVFLFVPLSLRSDALLRLPAQSSYLVAESGGKAIYTNQPLTANQPCIAQLPQHGGPEPSQYADQ